MAETNTNVLELDDEAVGNTTVEATKKFTDWEKEPTVIDLKQDLTDAKPDTDTHIGKVDGWLDNLNITGKAKRPKTKGRSNMVPKLIRKQAEWRYASLSEPFLSTSDLFDVDPISAEDKNAAIQNALVLNNQFNTKIKKIKFIDEYVRTAVDEGTVIVRVGWDFQEGQREVEQQLYTYRTAESEGEVVALQQAVAMMEADPGTFAALPEQMQASAEETADVGRPVIAVDAGTETVTESYTMRNHPTLEICNYKNIIIDPSCDGDLEIAEFLSYSFDSNLAALTADGKYTNLDAINVEGASPLTEPDHDSPGTENSSFNFTDKPRKKFVVHEYWGFWDANGDGILVPMVAAWVGDVLIRLEENPYPDQKIPFVTAQYLPVRRSIFGEPDGELLEDNQAVVGAVTRGMIDLMGRSANGQMGIRKDALDVTNRRKFEKGMDYEYNGGLDPRNAFYMHEYPDIPSSAPFMLAVQNTEAESLTGVKAFAGPKGLSGDSLGESVGGQKNAMDAAAKRELGILRRLAQGINEIGRKIISMNAEFLDEEEVIRITATEFVTVRRDDLAGEFDLRLSISTPEADDAKASELAFMLQTTAQTMGPAFAQIIMGDIARLRKMPDLAKRIAEYAPEPDPLEVMKQQLEVQLLQAQIKNENAKAFENTTDGQLNQAKSGNLQSATDKQDLDFVHEESGVNQERTLEQIDRSAGHNLQKSVVDQTLKQEGEAKNAANKSAKAP